MPRQAPPERWITGKEAAALLSKGRTRPVSIDYVRLLGVKGHIAMRDRDGRTKEYLEADVRNYQVRQNTNRSEERSSTVVVTQMAQDLRRPEKT